MILLNRGCYDTPASNNSKTVTNAKLQFSNMGNFHNTAGRRAWPFLNTAGKKQTTLPAILLVTHYSSYFHGIQAFLVIFRSTFPMAVVAQCQPGLWYKVQSISIICPSHSLVEYFALNFSQCYQKMYRSYLGKDKESKAVLGHLLKYARFCFVKIKYLRKKKSYTNQIPND